MPAKNRVSSKADSGWSEKRWFPRALRFAGLRFWCALPTAARGPSAERKEPFLFVRALPRPAQIVVAPLRDW